MNENLIINIENLSCSYSLDEKDRVLFIKNLSLERGKIIFLLGASGTGKSTLLETLGLMNNTIASGTVELKDGDSKYDYAGLWNSNSAEDVNTIRKKSLSFIFQNTNLMENFTAYENICLSRMIKSDVAQSKAMDNAVKLMRQVGLPESQVGYNTLSVNLSGGQRQRVSFVRALNSDFRLLLCDEPTGNLDEVNASELLNIVKQNLTSDKTAILVSHDVNLALKYADQIILITKNAQHGYGEILNENIFGRDMWSSLPAADLASFRSNIVRLFLPDTAGVHRSGSEEQIIQIKTENSYARLFRKKEGQVLMGKSWSNLSILTLIITFTFLAIGFANGALEYLNVKIKDPFVNWITIPLPSSKSTGEPFHQIMDNLNANKVRQEFFIDSVTSYKETQLLFFPLNNPESEFSKGRILTYDDPISDDLFGPDNLIAGDTGFISENDLAIVVTEKLLKRLGYDKHAKFIWFDDNDKNVLGDIKSNFKVPIPVRAVIKNIPNRNNFLITKFFHLSYLAHEDCVFDFNYQKKRIIYFTGDDKDLVKKFQEEVRANFSKLSDDVAPEDMTIDFEKYDKLTEPGYVLSVSFNTAPEEAIVTEKLAKQIETLKIVNDNKSKIFRIFDFDIARQQPENVIYDYLSINFTRLDKIEDFSKYIVKSLNASTVKSESNIVEVDAGIVKEKNNFNYMSKMTLLISGLLIAFSILSILLFISNLLKKHLNKVKSNLGTFKAFGLSDRESKSIYMKIMLRFITLSLIISLVLSFAIGKIAEMGFASRLRIDDQSEYFRLFDLQTLGVIITIILVTIVVSYYNINKILSKTPGDLIYNR